MDSRVLSRSSSGSIPFFVGFYPVLPCALSRALKMPARGGLMGSMEGQLRCFFTSYVPRLAAAWLLFYVHEVDMGSSQNSEKIVRQGLEVSG